jgi:hypothetical protein
VVERSLAGQYFISEDTETPKIHCHIVFDSLENLRSHVIEGAAIGLPSLVADRSPPEIAELIDVLNSQGDTLEITIF